MSMTVLLALLGYIFNSSGGDTYRIFSNSGQYLSQVLSINGWFVVHSEDTDLICTETQNDNPGWALYRPDGGLVISADDILHRDGDSGEWIALDFTPARNELTISSVSAASPLTPIATISTASFVNGFPKLLNGFWADAIEGNELDVLVLTGSTREGGWRIEVYSLVDGSLISATDVRDVLNVCPASQGRIQVTHEGYRREICDLQGGTIVGPEGCGGSLTVQDNGCIVYDEYPDSNAVFNSEGQLVYEWRVPDETGYLGTRFSEGLLPCADETGRYGYIDSTGSWLILPRFDDAGPFCSGIAAIRLDGEWGYIDKTGSYIIQPQFDQVLNFCGDFGAVKTASGLMYGLTRAGELIGPGYYSVSPERYGLFSVSDNRQAQMRFSIINSFGDLIVPFSTRPYSVY
jgi:hypothetical protein